MRSLYVVEMAGSAVFAITGVPTLIMSRDIYATPIVLGCSVFVLLRRLSPEFALADVVAMGLPRLGRAPAIRWHLQMPE